MKLRAAGSETRAPAITSTNRSLNGCCHATGRRSFTKTFSGAGTLTVGRRVIMHILERQPLRPPAVPSHWLALDGDTPRPLRTLPQEAPLQPERGNLTHTTLVPINTRAAFLRVVHNSFPRLPSSQEPLHRGGTLAVPQVRVSDVR